MCPRDWTFFLLYRVSFAWESEPALFNTSNKCLNCAGLSYVRLFATTWLLLAPQAPLSRGLSRQEHWSGLPCPPSGDLPNSRIELGSPALQVDSSPAELTLLRLGAAALNSTDMVLCTDCSPARKTPGTTVHWILAKRILWECNKETAREDFPAELRSVTRRKGGEI